MLDYVTPPFQKTWGRAIVIRCLDVAIVWAVAVALANAQAMPPRVFATAVDLNSGQVIEYEIRPDGYAIWGDIVIGTAADISRNGLRLPEPLSRSAMAQDADKKHIQQNYFGSPLWRLPIPYQFADPVLAPLVEPAIADLAQKTVLSFVPRTTETDFIEFAQTPGSTSVSHGIGNGGGRHLIEIGDLVNAAPGRYGAVQHEILHALGFAHEQQRKDRDDYIDLHPECIESSALSQYTTKYNTVPFGAYDFESVMHYRSTEFSTSNQCLTFTVKAGRSATVNVPNCATHSIGQGCGISPGDADAVNYFYSRQTGFDPNQHGLTGSWYEPATSGQGFALEIFPNVSPGTGLAFGSWFTFDAIAGGAERQRWYTLQGPVATGQSNAVLSIYRNTGGNFNAPPATGAQVVGTATLSFNACSSGQLTYTFTDGSGRAGTISLTRLLPNVTCSAKAPRVTNADFALSGSWYAGIATSGQGFMAEVAPSIGAFLLSWFTYAPNGAAFGPAGQRWYTAQGAFTPGLRTIPVMIYETTGGTFDAPPSAGQGNLAVGTGTMRFLSCSAATFSYNFTGGSSIGRSGTVTLGRVGPAPPGC